MSDEWTDRLSAYLDDELSAEARARVTAHLATCDACAQELEALQELRAGLSATLPAALERHRAPRALG